MGIKQLILSKQFLFSVFLFTLPWIMLAQVKSSNGQVFAVNDYDKERIQFLHLHASLENGKEQIGLSKSEIRPGRLKKAMDISIHHHSSEVDLICSVLDAKGKLLLEKTMPYPFKESLEYVDEDTGGLQRKEVALETKDFLIRLPYKEDYAMLRIEKQLNSSDQDAVKKELISLIKLK